MFDKEITEGFEIMGDKIAENAEKAYDTAKEGTMNAYQKIEDTVVDGYKKIEDTVVGGYKKIENAFVGKFFAKDGETPETAKARMMQEYEAREEKMRADMEKRAKEQQEIIDRANRMV